MTDLMQSLPFDAMFAARHKMIDALDVSAAAFQAAFDAAIPHVTYLPSLYFGTSHPHLTVAGLQPKNWREALVRHIDEQFWHTVIYHPTIAALLSPGKKEELRKHLGEKTVPEFTEDVLYATLEFLANNAEAMFLDTVMHVWKRLSRHHVTNDEYAFAKTIIVKGYTDRFGPSRQLPWDHIVYDFEKCVRRVQGLQPTDTSHTVDELGQWCQLPGSALKVTLYKNANVHMQITDKEVRTKLNKILSQAAVHGPKESKGKS